MSKPRYLTPYILADLKEKMVFLSGPRQVGKTTLSQKIGKDDFKQFAYLNWDLRADREQILKTEWPADAELIIFDEIHKYRKWKTLIKGYYDKYKERYKFFVTGSARINIYRRGSDSLQGRYHHCRLHPFSLAEYCEKKNLLIPGEKLIFPSEQNQEALDTLFRFGGFPEPLFKQDERHLRRWHKEKLERLFREDIREVEMIRDLSGIQLLSDLIPGRVGSLLSLNSLREDLEVSHRTVTHWMSVLESFYYHFRMTPYVNRLVRGLKKESKYYLWDWSEIEDPGARFENLVASHLHKLVHFLNDIEGYHASLHFLRDKEKREVDFLVAVNNKPWFACEVKISDAPPSKHLAYFKEKLDIPFAYQVAKSGQADYETPQGIRLLPAAKFLSSLI